MRDLPIAVGLTEPTDAEVQVYRRTARERWQAREQERLERFDGAWVVARAAAALLRDRFGATRVAVFGSLLHRNRFRLTSDIDLAAWGIEGIAFYEAVAHLMDLTDRFKIDLVDPESCRESLREAIATEGVDVWLPPS